MTVRGLSGRPRSHCWQTTHLGKKHVYSEVDSNNSFELIWVHTPAFLGVAQQRAWLPGSQHSWQFSVFCSAYERRGRILVHVFISEDDKVIGCISRCLSIEEARGDVCLRRPSEQFQSSCCMAYAIYRPQGMCFGGITDGFRPTFGWEAHEQAVSCAKISSVFKREVTDWQANIVAVWLQVYI